MEWTGRIYKCIYGMAQSDIFEVTSEPYSLEMLGELVVDGISDMNGEVNIECDRLENQMYWKLIRGGDIRNKPTTVGGRTAKKILVRATWEFEADVEAFDPAEIKIYPVAVELVKAELRDLLKKGQLTVDDFSYHIEM